MTNFDDTVSAKALIVSQGVHSGPTADGQAGAINGSVHVYDEHGRVTSGMEVGTVRSYDSDGVMKAELCVDAASKVGRVYLSDLKGQTKIHLDGTGAIYACNGKGEHTVEINGDQGDIYMYNADIAEEFDLADTGSRADCEPGTLVRLTTDSAVAVTQTPYDRALAGVIAGAGRYRPGITLDRRPTGSPRVAVSLFGKVYCKADATYGAIVPGDPLTSSATAGHAMRADDSAPVGTVIGKSLGHLPSGIGIVPMLVCMR